MFLPMSKRVPAFMLAFVAVMMLGLMTAVPVHAQNGSTNKIDPTWSTTLEIHKFEQPTGAALNANGLPQDTTGLTPVSGATFIAKKVPGVDLTTSAGQREAAGLTVDEAAGLVTNGSEVARVVTDGQGNATMADLGVGLYFLQETNIKNGYIGSSPFLVALPLTDPANRDSWLRTVHVYPKDAKVAITLDVIDEHAVAIGETIYWVSRSNIPNRTNIDGYLVEELINENLEFIGAPGNLSDDVDVSLDCPDCEALEAGRDYTLDYDKARRVLSVNFTDQGLRKLEDAVKTHPTARVRIKYDTKVLREGIHTNTANVFGSNEAISNRSGVSDDATTKWGPLSVIVHEVNKPSNRIPGARFKLYETRADAISGTNPIIVDGVDEWTTDSNGQLIIHGLRFSGFYNGLDNPENSEHYNRYWAAPINTPDGWKWVNDEPLVGGVHHETEYEELIFEVYKESEGRPPFIPIFPIFPGAETPPGSSGQPVPPDSGELSGDIPREGTADKLASTGAQVTGIFFLALALIGGGILLMLRKRRDPETP